MAALTIVYAGPPEQRHATKITAMQPLAAVLAEACSKFRLEPQTSALYLAKKPLDLSTPFRLANIPAGSRLDLITGVLPPPSKPVPPPTASAMETGEGHEEEAASTRGPGEGGAQGAAAVDEDAAAAAAKADAAAAAEAAAEADAAAKAAAEAEAAAAAAEEAALAAAAARQPLGADRPLSIYTRAALEAAAAEAAAEAAAASASAAADPPDDFFEMDVADYAVFSRSLDARKKGSAYLKTSSLREAEERARVEAFGPVPVCVHLSDGHVIQATFRAGEGVARIQELVSLCLAPEVRGAAYLYTTPPKAVLRDGEATLYRAGLVPAAHVHCGIDAAAAGSYSGPLLCPEAAALVQHAVKRPRVVEEGVPEAVVGAAGDGAAGAAREAPPVQLAPGSGPGNYTASGSKVPKWMKMGAKK